MYAVAVAGCSEMGAGALRALGVPLHAEQLAIAGQAAGEPERGIALGGTQVEHAPRAHGAHQKLQQRADHRADDGQLAAGGVRFQLAQQRAAGRHIAAEQGVGLVDDAHGRTSGGRGGRGQSRA